MAKLPLDTLEDCKGCRKKRRSSGRRGNQNVNIINIGNEIDKALKNQNVPKKQRKAIIKERTKHSVQKIPVTGSEDLTIWANRQTGINVPIRVFKYNGIKHIYRAFY